MGAPESYRYRICVEGCLDPAWSDRIAGMKIERGDTGPTDTTILTGELVDLSALYGVLNTLLELRQGAVNRDNSL